MMAKRQITKRELWLMSVLPGALVMIISMGLPNASKDITAAENQLERLMSTDARMRQATQLRELRAQSAEYQETQAELASQEVAIQTQINVLETPVTNRTQSLTQALHTLTVRLVGHGVQVLAMGKAKAESRSNAQDSGQQDWTVSVIASWTAMSEALADPDVFPSGLVLLAITMEQPKSPMPLRHWELTVIDLGGKP